MDLNLEGRSALVCGASRGIGKAAAVELARLGASVTLVARNEDSLAAALTERAIAVANPLNDFLEEVELVN